MKSILSFMRNEFRKAVSHRTTIVNTEFSDPPGIKRLLSIYLSKISPIRLIEFSFFLCFWNWKYFSCFHLINQIDGTFVKIIETDMIWKLYCLYYLIWCALLSNVFICFYWLARNSRVCNVIMRIESNTGNELSLLLFIVNVNSSKYSYRVSQTNCKVNALQMHLTIRS